MLKRFRSESRIVGSQHLRIISILPETGASLCLAPPLPGVLARRTFLFFELLVSCIRRHCIQHSHLCDTVASDTSLSRVLMPSSKAAISSFGKRNGIQTFSQCSGIGLPLLSCARVGVSKNSLIMSLCLLGGCIINAKAEAWDQVHNHLC